jgi:ketosteroid isomerase-like protein
MNKSFIFLLVLFIIQNAYSQKSLDGLIQAERSFAAYAVSNNTKNAFLTFLDSTGIVFEKGQPVNGIDAWNKKEARPGILNWHPQFAEIASSNEFGYTTGPWTFQPKSVTDSVVATGQYTTVWHINKNGEWKFLVDLGVSNVPTTDSQEVQKITVEKITTNPIDLASLVKAEEKFIKAFKKNRTTAYNQFLSQHSILNRNQQLPATSTAEQKTTIEATPQQVNFTINGSRIAKSGDLGFVFGTTTLKNQPENYLRIWRREKEGWKIALEVLRQ